MWPLDRLSCDLSFTETISRRMQVPNHLCVPGEQKLPKEDLPPSFRMQVPERLVFSETTGVASEPLLEKQQIRLHIPGVVDELLSGPFLQAAVHGEVPILSFVSQDGMEKRKHQAPHGRIWKARPILAAEEIPQAPPDTSRLKQPQLESSEILAVWSPSGLLPSPTPTPTQGPPFLPEGRIYSLRNVLRALHFLGQRHLSRLFWQPGHPGQLSAQEVRRRPEEFGPMDVQTMRNQLTLISGRLQALEAEGVGSHRKELFFYSVLVSACLLDLGLWLRR